MQRGLSSKAMSDDFIIARKVQEEMLARGRSVLDSSGAKRDLSVREDARARFMTGGGYRLLASANLGELVLGFIEATFCK